MPTTNNDAGGVSLLTLSAVMGECKNFFVRMTRTGDFAISGGVLTGAEGLLMPGQYYRIVGSIFNEGVFRYGGYGVADDALTDETFSGRVDALAPPRDFIALAAEIADWQDKYGAAAASPFISESFGGYAYTKASGVTQDGGAGGWQAAFRAKLARYRKL